MSLVKDFLEIMYYIAFIILTILLVIYAKKTYTNEKKAEPLLLARINYNLSDISKNYYLPVTIDLLNSGDLIMKDIHIEFGSKNDKKIVHKELIQFISGHKLYKYCIGTYNPSDGNVNWIDGTVTKAFTKNTSQNELSSCELQVNGYTVTALHF